MNMAARGWVGSSRMVCRHMAAGARRPGGRGRVGTETRELLPRLAAVGRAKRGAASSTPSVDRVRIVERRLEMPDAGELPGMGHAIVPQGCVPVGAVVRELVFRPAPTSCRRRSSAGSAARTSRCPATRTGDRGRRASPSGGTSPSRRKSGPVTSQRSRFSRPPRARTRPCVSQPVLVRRPCLASFRRPRAAGGPPRIIESADPKSTGSGETDARGSSLPGRPRRDRDASARTYPRLTPQRSDSRKTAAHADGRPPSTSASASRRPISRTAPPRRRTASAFAYQVTIANEGQGPREAHAAALDHHRRQRRGARGSRGPGVIGEQPVLESRRGPPVHERGRAHDGRFGTMEGTYEMHGPDGPRLQGGDPALRAPEAWRVAVR